ncbi:HAMP domain-containing histidine kinase [Clostridium sp. 'deep sea']|uniref:sensor histidine kinase n=1 Tax=Clostridium sp. 'deep sea' TaxID=2779445 RepID=UPI0018967635|nr:HAMP domain-containing sensor histidine kinase [Clostridium sp. 'deep sea']QOR35217.1 HAMP domain-containing histidine kinase [Clostridium sp. 'deep sea']
MPIYIVFFLILFILGTLGIAFFLHIVNIEKPNGETATSAWPKTFTKNFSTEIIIVKDEVLLKNSGIEKLEKYGLWFQLLDTSGKEIIAYNTAPDLKTEYTVFELLDITGGKQTNKTETVFAGVYVKQGIECTYLIGFPVNISKVIMYLNGEHFTNGKSIVVTILFAVCVFIMLFGFFYGLWITRKMQKITKSVFEIALRTYTPIKQVGLFEDVYVSLNQLDSEIQASDELRDNTELLRKEWIEGITHDLKTPLSPIKGYGELLTNTQYEISTSDIRKYGNVILKNINYTESLINDLKLIYQMENGTTNTRISKVNIVRQLKEIIIDLLNTPEYENCKINFISSSNEIYTELDISLFRRAISNIIINAIIHNAKDTDILVTIELNDNILISIQDNGTGLTTEEQKKLFTRYYRGTNTEAKPEGTGLGMGIVKQIVELHDGKIEVDSIYGEGTRITISLPHSN